MEPDAAQEYPIDRFVVGVDGSKGSRAALRFGATVAADSGAKLRVAMAWEHPTSAALPTGPNSLASRDEGDAATAGRLRDLIGEELGDDGTLAQPIVLRGRPSRSLMRVAVDHPGAVLVVGTRGRGGFTEMVLGSTCRSLLHDDRVPVIVVHPEQPQTPERITHIVIGIDGTPGSLSAASWGASLAARLGADVIAVHALPVGTGDWLLPDTTVAMAEILELVDGPWTAPIRAAGVPCRTLLIEEDPREAILRVAQETGSGLVVMGRASGQGLSRWAIGNVAESVVRHAKVPVAVVSHLETEH
jgi:nucleotide-binding universal stress UspA family protein